MDKAPIFLLSFAKRYWRLLIVFLVINALAKIDAVTYAIGPIFFLLQMAIGALVAGLLLIHVFLRRSFDAYAQTKEQDDGTKESDFEREWRQLQPAERVFLRVAVILIFFLGCAWIAASIAK